MKRKVPKMTTDEEAEAFLQQDLSDLDFAQFKSVQIDQAIESIRSVRKRTGKITVGELLSARHEGHKY